MFVENQEKTEEKIFSKIQIKPTICSFSSISRRFFSSFSLGSSLDFMIGTLTENGVYLAVNSLLHGSEQSFLGLNFVLEIGDLLFRGLTRGR
eukprot:UN15882